MQIAISGTVMARNMGSKSRPVDLVLEDYRKLLCSVFNPLFSGKLTRNMMGGLYFVEARANSTPIFDTVFGGTLPFSVDLYADEPYWKLDDKRIIDIGPSETETVFPGETQETVSYTHLYGTRYRVIYNRKEPELTSIFEDGTVDRYTKSGQYRGRIEAKPHIRPAFYKAVERHKKELGG